jgi:hypothetical protein
LQEQGARQVAPQLSLDVRRHQDLIGGASILFLDAAPFVQSFAFFSQVALGVRVAPRVASVAAQAQHFNGSHRIAAHENTAIASFRRRWRLALH